MTDRLVIEVVYITPDAERVVSVELAADAVVEDAIVACGILQAAPELDLETLQVGIYGRLVSLSTKLEAEERVEIYRPLVLDPHGCASAAGSIDRATAPWSARETSPECRAQQFG